VASQDKDTLGLTSEAMATMMTTELTVGCLDDASVKAGLVGEIDIRHLLPQIKIPTLVLHGRGDQVVPFEEGRILAAEIPGARFVPLESRNHVLLETEPAWERMLEATRAFLAESD